MTAKLAGMLLLSLVLAGPAAHRLFPTDQEIPMDTAIFAAGCFWGVEATFRELEGVVDTRVGYTGGTTESPTYREVCTDTTGHAEAVEVTYDPDQISYDELLAVFWRSHNPTREKHKAQYRSAIFTTSEAQAEAAQQARAAVDASDAYDAPLVTQIAPAATFWEAEEHHQQYYEKRGMAPACKR